MQNLNSLLDIYHCRCTKDLTQLNTTVLCNATPHTSVDGYQCPEKTTASIYSDQSCTTNMGLAVSSNMFVHSVEQKSIGTIFRTSRSGSAVRYSCHHNLSPITFPIFAHSWRFSVFHSLQSITPRIY